MTQIVPLKTKMVSMRQMLAKQEGELKRAMPRGLDPIRYVRTFLTVIGRNPNLLNCEPTSVLGSLMQAASFGLELDPVLAQAYLVPYKTQCQLIVGYQGLVALAMRTPDVKSVVARAVYEKDTFHYELGINEKLVHVPTDDPDKGNLTHVYAIGKLVDREGLIPIFEVMSVKEVEKVRARSKAAQSGPWVTDYEAMAKKTVVRRLSKWLPKSTEFMQAVASEDRLEAGMINDGIDELVDDVLREPAIDAKAEPDKALPEGQPKTALDAFVEGEKAKAAPAATPAPTPVPPVPSRVPGEDDDDPRPAHDPRPGTPPAATAREEAARAQQARHEPPRGQQPARKAPSQPVTADDIPFGSRGE